MHPEALHEENKFFTNMESHFPDSSGVAVSHNTNENYTDLPLEIVSRHRGWSESSVPPEVAGATPIRAQIHPMEDKSQTPSRETMRNEKSIKFSSYKESSPLTMSHFAGGDARITESSFSRGGSQVTPYRSQSSLQNTPLSRGSVGKASSDRLQRLGDDLQVLARKLDAFDSNRIKY